MMRKPLTQPLVKASHGLALKRRQFLQGCLGASVLGTPSLGLAATPARSGVPTRAVYQDMPYFDFSGHGDVYIPPRKK